MNKDIIFCKNCVYAESNAGDNGLICQKRNDTVKENDFCSDGVQLPHCSGCGSAEYLVKWEQVLDDREKSLKFRESRLRYEKQKFARQKKTVTVLSLIALLVSLISLVTKIAR